MQCPNDQTLLAMTDRQGIEIDYCPTCRGVWLDRGELDKLIAGGERNSAPTTSAPQQHYAQRDERDHREDKRSDHYSGQQKKHKKESFLGELFDF